MELVLVNFVDDFGLFARSASKLASAIDALRQAVGHVPGGIFNLAEKSVGNAHHGITFLGHIVQVKEGEVRTWPVSDNSLYNELEKIERAICKLLYLPPYMPDSPQAIELLARYVAVVQGWAAAYSECDNLDDCLHIARANIKQWSADIGVSPDAIKSAITPDMTFRPDKYEL